jgi:hypothetical protein
MDVILLFHLMVQNPIDIFLNQMIENRKLQAHLSWEKYTPPME